MVRPVSLNPPTHAVAIAVRKYRGWHAPPLWFGTREEWFKRVLANNKETAQPSRFRADKSLLTKNPGASARSVPTQALP